jgi:BRO family, N-terminal domain
VRKVLGLGNVPQPCRASMMTSDAPSLIMRVVATEAGVYRLIFGSRKPEAERFNRRLALRLASAPR